MDVSMMNRPEYPDTGEFCPICTTLHVLCRILFRCQNH